MTVQCKDIPDEPILRLLALRPKAWHNWYFGDDKDVRNAMPTGTHEKLVLGKMRMLIRRGLVSGCGCLQWLEQSDKARHASSGGV